MHIGDVKTSWLHIHIIIFVQAFVKTLLIADSLAQCVTGTEFEFGKHNGATNDVVADH